MRPSRNRTPGSDPDGVLSVGGQNPSYASAGAAAPALTPEPAAERIKLVTQGTGFLVSLGGRSRAIGLGMPSRMASQRKNCCSARNWPRA
jgi:hypothetical protein